MTKRAILSSYTYETRSAIYEIQCVGSTNPVRRHKIVIDLHTVHILNICSTSKRLQDFLSKPRLGDAGSSRSFTIQVVEAFPWSDCGQMGWLFSGDGPLGNRKIGNLGQGYFFIRLWLGRSPFHKIIAIWNRHTSVCKITSPIGSNLPLRAGDLNRWCSYSFISNVHQ